MAALQQFLSLQDRDIVSFRVHVPLQSLALFSLALLVYVLFRCKVLDMVIRQSVKVCKDYRQVSSEKKEKKESKVSCVLSEYKKKKSKPDYVIRKFLWAYQEIMQSGPLAEEDRSTMNKTLSNTLRNAKLPQVSSPPRIAKQTGKRVSFKEDDIVTIVSF